MENEKKGERQKKAKQKQEESGERRMGCANRLCLIHGRGGARINLRGRSFTGRVIRKFPKRICIEFERTIYVRKYEGYIKKKTKIHARLPDCLAASVNIGDYVEIKECRPVSKIINFVVLRKIR